MVILCRGLNGARERTGATLKSNSMNDADELIMAEYDKLLSNKIN
jgi:hypothetical protein